MTVIAAHAGFGWWQQLAFLISKKVNLLTDISGWQPVAFKDFDLFCRYIRDLISIAGAQNIIFATDGPAYAFYGMSNQWWVELFKNLPEMSPSHTKFDPEDVEAILYKNAQRVLGTAVDHLE